MNVHPCEERLDELSDKVNRLVTRLQEELKSGIQCSRSSCQWVGHLDETDNGYCPVCKDDTQPAHELDSAVKLALEEFNNPDSVSIPEVVRIK